MGARSASGAALVENKADRSAQSDIVHAHRLETDQGYTDLSLKVGRSGASHPEHGAKVLDDPNWMHCMKARSTAHAGDS
jgi:hypothetical protein